jgi:hypothetical protein
MVRTGSGVRVPFRACRLRDPEPLGDRSEVALGTGRDGDGAARAGVGCAAICERSPTPGVDQPEEGVVVDRRLARGDEHARLVDGREIMLSGHAVAETYSLLTRLPGDVRVAPADAELATRDARATATYEAIGARVIAVGD